MTTCPECSTGCNGEIVSDKCVKYTGPKIDLLGICPGIPLSDLEAIIVDKLQVILKGEFKLDQIDLTCPTIKDLIGKADPTLFNLIQSLVKANCTLKEALDTLTKQANATSAFDTSCLTFPAGVTAPTKDQILQAAITKICSINTRVKTVEDNYVKSSDINTLIQEYFQNVNNTPAQVQYYATLPAKVALPYFGNLSNFDNEGKGLEAKGMKNLFLCNGKNGTPDLRGFTLVGAIANVPGAVLHASVDPTLPANAGNNYALNDKFGSQTVTLTPEQVPAHSHDVNDPGHTHFAVKWSGLGKNGLNNDKVLKATDTVNTSSHEANGNQDYDFTVGPPGEADRGVTSKATTGITVKPSTGGGQKHDNRQPSHACYYIMAIY